MTTSPTDVVVAFNDAINARDLGALSRLMADGHRFTDSAGGSIEGRQAGLTAWQGFFEAFPDYRNHFEHIAVQDGVVVITGHSTCSDDRLAGPALWTAAVVDGEVAEWRVHEDSPAERTALGLPLN